MTNSRDKGVRGERLARDLLKKYGFEARRGQQYAGGGDSPDVVHNIPNLHVEVKFVEALSAYTAMEQARGDAAGGDVPTVFHKRKNKPWLVIMDAHDFLCLMRRLTNDE